MNIIVKLLTPGTELRPEELKKCLRLAVYSGLSLLVTVLGMAAYIALSGGETSRAYQTHDFLLHSLLGLGKWVLVVFAGWLTLEVIDSSSRGSRYLHADPRNAVFVFCALILAAAYVFGGI